MGTTKVYENPLINNKKLRQLYVAMAGVRVLDEFVLRGTGKGKKSGRLNSIRGEEACRVSTAIELVEGDLVSDSQAGVMMDFVAGATMASLLRRLTTTSSGMKGRRAKPSSVNGAAQMPWVEDVGERLRIAAGAALAFKTLKRPNIVVAYVYPGEVGGKDWRRILALASKFELPMIFVVLPKAGGRERRDGANVSAFAKSHRIPCIPVDAADAVALYRVAQESMGRVRGDGGPVVLECLEHRLEGQRKAAGDDPILQMRGFLLGRKVCGPAWLNRVGESFRRRLAAVR